MQFSNYNETQNIFVVVESMWGLLIENRVLALNPSAKAFKPYPNFRWVHLCLLLEKERPTSPRPSRILSNSCHSNLTLVLRHYCEHIVLKQCFLLLFEVLAGLKLLVFRHQLFFELLSLNW